MICSDCLLNPSWLGLVHYLPRLNREVGKVTATFIQTTRKQPSLGIQLVNFVLYLREFPSPRLFIVSHYATRLSLLVGNSTEQGYQLSIINSKAINPSRNTPIFIIVSICSISDCIQLFLVDDYGSVSTHQSCWQDSIPFIKFFFSEF